MANFVGNYALNTYTLAENGVSDVAWSNDEKTIYAATTDGKIKVFDVATHSLLNTWNIGKSLGALSLSDDSKTLVAGGVTATDVSVVYAINTATGTKSTFTPAGSAVRDVEIIDNQRVLVGGGNFTGQLQTLDLSTGTFAALAITDSDNPAFSVMTEDQHLTLLGEGFNGNGPLFLYDDRTGTIVASAGGFQANINYGGNRGMQAISEATNRVYQLTSGGINVYDLNLKGLKFIDVGIESAQGLALDPAGKFISVYGSNSFDGGTVKTYRLADLALVATYTAPSFQGYTSATFGNALKINTSGDVISVITQADSFNVDGSLTLIDLTSRNETFKGTAGADTFAGGLGNDTYTVNNAGDRITERANGGTDKVITAMTYTLTNNIETLQLIGRAAINGTGNTDDNTLFGNAGINTLDGGRGDDRLVGVGGGDTLIGGLGNDTLTSGRGIDTLISGAGNDTYGINDSGDVIQEDPAGGIDTVQIAASYVLGGTLENLVLGGEAVSGTGNALNNTITGNLAANTLGGGDGNDTLLGLARRDVLLGGAGNDTLDGGTGADTMTGGTGNDTYIADNADDAIIEVAVGGGTDRVIASVNWKLADGLENLMLAPGTAPLSGTGNNLANVITGNAGNNVLDGGGSDFGFAPDTLIGGMGNDTYIAAPDGFDRFDIIEQAGQGTDRVVSAFSFNVLPEFVENLVLTGGNDISGGGNAIANTVTGNTGSNIIYGYEGSDRLIGEAGNDVLYGGAGNDTLQGGIGNDTYFVDDAADRVIEKAGEGRDFVQTVITLTIPDEIEVLTLDLALDINATGSSRSDTLIGNSGVNTLDGKAGADVLADHGFNDTLIGGSGADYFLFGSAGVRSNGGAVATITDFSSAEEDLISLIYTDANPATPEFDPMTFIGTSAFSGAGGEVRYQQTGANTFVTGDIDGDEEADFTIQLTGLINLAQSDFEFAL